MSCAAAFDAEIREIRLWQNRESSPAQFYFDAPEKIEKWLGEFFRFAVTLRREPQKGFPDDREAFGPTITSDAGLREIQNGFPN